MDNNFTKNNKSSIGECLSFIEGELEKAKVFLGHGTDNYWDESVHLLLQTLDIHLDSDKDILQREITEDEWRRVEINVDKRIIERIPVPYIVGKAWFCGLSFFVDKNVLIPRSPIGELISKGFRPWLAHKPRRILDLCCGSACIGIACAEVFPDAEVCFTDISPEALKVSKKNSEQYNLSGRASICEGDLFDALAEKHDGTRFDLIIANPPYVDTVDMAILPLEYHHEPRMALEAGQDGLDVVRRILQEALHYLSDDGILIVEVGNSWETLENAYPDVPFLWLEFEQGGHGVFLFTAKELKKLD